MKISTTLGLRELIKSSMSRLINGSGLFCVPGFIVGEGVGFGIASGLSKRFVGRVLGVALAVGVGVGVIVGAVLSLELGIAGVPETEFEAVPSPALLTALI